MNEPIPINSPSRAELHRRVQLALSILGHRPLLPASTAVELTRVLRGESVGVSDPQEAS